MKSRKVGKRLLFACVVSAFAVEAFAVDWPSFVPSKVDLPGVYRPYAFNADGEMVGFKLLDTPARWGRERLGWRREGVESPEIFRDLPGGDRHAALIDINDDGLAVGFGSIAGEPDRPFVDDVYSAPNGSKAVVVTPFGKVVSLEPMLVPEVDSIALRVNRSGQVVGQLYRWVDPNGYTRARTKPFVWSEAQGAIYPFGLRDDDDPKFGNVTVGAINDLGRLAGIATSAFSYETVGYTWDPGSGFEFFGFGVWAVNAINNLGVVVGRDELRNAFAWQSGGGQRKLPLLDDPGDRHDCAANDVNDAGWIVGRCGHYATLWLPDGQGGYAVAKLNDLVEQDGVPMDRFRWSEAIRIGEDGRILLWTHEDERSRVWDLEGPPYSSVLLTPVVNR